MKFLRRLAPKTLFARALLILVLPVLLLQMIAVTIFYERHWASVTRQLSSSLAGEVTWLVEHWEEAQRTKRQNWLAIQADRHYGLKVKLLPPMQIDPTDQLTSDTITRDVQNFSDQLDYRLDRPYSVRFFPKSETLHVYVPVERGMLQIEAPKKRLASSTNLIFIAWMLGSALILLAVASLFLRNQIRPIVRLSRAADQFGKGQEVENFRPSGALEVRQAARAFLAMRDRISRQVETRTTMLAGISHDLKTPLTRMLLSLEMRTPQDEETKELREDVLEMQHMIDSYLAFAKGEKAEERELTPINEWLMEAVRPYQRDSDTLMIRGTIAKRSVLMRPKAMQRALRNLIDNALRYGEHCWVSVKFRAKRCEIMIDDDGQGIAPEHRDEVLRAFTRLDESRNLTHSGSGLGLSIVRDIIHAHGGEITLKDAPKTPKNEEMTGLRVVITLPL